MPMPPYPLLCYTRTCGQPAAFKIAARWSDGVTQELKTYSLCCDTCLPETFRQGCAKQKACRLAPGEILEPPGIYRLQRGLADQGLERLVEREKELGS
jgi:hypothetical protein